MQGIGKSGRKNRFAGDVDGGGGWTGIEQLLGELFGRAGPDEHDFLARLLMGELRQGALEGVMTDAVATAAAVSPATLRRAVMLG